MRFSIITPSFNGGIFLEECIKSVLTQRHPDLELEYIVVDGGSTDNSHQVLAKYSNVIDHILIEQDTGPANAINKGFSLATGDFVAWLNVDDIYFPGTLLRIQKMSEDYPDASFCFGNCPIIDEQGEEIRSLITRFKEIFHPVSSYFTYQCINYLSQPALFFRRSAINKAGKLREDMIAAWDYEFIIRLWHQGGAIRVKGDPLAAFRWHSASISGQSFKEQFREEFMVAKEDAGTFSLQTLIHFFVRWGIVSTYSVMSGIRSFSPEKNK